MKRRWMSWLRSVRKRNQFVVKLGVTVLLLGLAFRLLVNRSFSSSPASGDPFVDNSRNSVASVVSLDSQQNGDQVVSKEYVLQSQDAEDGKCNLFVGNWMPCTAEPFYSNNTCSFIEDHQNCMKNGRPDTGYLYWRWKPHGCELHQFEPKRFLKIMRNKSFAFIGDSISRNHVQSFLCMISVVENPVEFTIMRTTNPEDGSSHYTTSLFLLFGHLFLPKLLFLKMSMVYLHPRSNCISHSRQELDGAIHEPGLHDHFKWQMVLQDCSLL